MPHSISVLLIDDDPAQCETLGDILADHGCLVLPCSDPGRGEMLGRERRFDLVLLDLKMAGIDGVELLRRIQVQPHGCVIVLTGMVEPWVKRAALAEGASAVMDKPVDIPRLLEIAHEVQATGDCKTSSSLVPLP
jgi:CheY-like chemotaxis protein